MDLKVDPNNQKYCAVWRSDELDNRRSALLMIRPVRLFRPKTGVGAEIRVFPTPDYTQYPIGVRLPDGLYKYYLADAETQDPLTPIKQICFGEKQRIDVEQVSISSDFYRITLRSPLPLQAGDCFLAYDIGIHIPLPEAVPNGTEYNITFLLRHRINAKICTADEVCKMFDLSAARLF